MVKIAIVSTVKAPIEQLRLFINYHLNIGVDEIVLFFDDTLGNDLETFPEYENVHTIACSPDYWLKMAGERPEYVWQREIVNVNEGVKIVSKKGCNWLIHIDSDELINPLKNIKEILAESNAEAIRFSLFEAVSEKEKYDYLFEPNMFKKESSSAQIKLAKSFGCRNAIFEGAYIRGHTLSKMAVKIGPHIKIYEIHNSIKHEGDLIVENTKYIQLLHYDCVDFNAWSTKWELRMSSGKSNVMGPNREKQFFLYKEAKSKGKEELVSLFKRLYFVPMQERIVLSILGMLKRVKLEQKLFVQK